MPVYQYILVLPVIPTATLYTYKARQEYQIQLGTYVKVDIRGKEVVGIVWDFTTSTLPEHQVKEIQHLYSLPPLGPTQRHFLTWVAQYTLFPLGSVLKLCLGSGEFLDPPSLATGYRLGAHLESVTPKRRQVIEAFQRSSVLSKQEIKEFSDASNATLRAMIQAHQLEPCILEPTYPCYQHREVDLSHDQREAVRSIEQAISQSDYQVYLLDGVTGSGKTEVYLSCTATALACQKQTLIMLPEISLTTQTIQRFTKCFGDKPYVWHSGMTQTQRHKTWQAVAQGHAQVVIGARSALFLPYKHLGLIVVDEEHDSSYKQEDGILYQARDMAVVKAHIEKIPIVLASATPSLETYNNAQSGKYQHLKLRSRHGCAVMPNIRMIDMRLHQQKSGARWLSAPLVSALKENLQQGQQSLLFLNRRGYAPLTLCRTCGERLQCPYCSTWLVAHKNSAKLICHHCGFKRLHPQTCSKCGEENSFVPCGPGVERIAEEVKALFPDARVLIMDRDNVHTPQQLDEVLKKIHDHKVDLLIGTQMIAKGHHFPKLTLVGVVDADLGLEGGDLRACEKTYQLLHQVSGRAGREHEKGEVYLQTFNPQHPVLQTLVNNERDAFYILESDNRRRMGLPPYGRLVSLIISGPSEAKVAQIAQQLAKNFPDYANVQLLGPAPAALSKIRAQYRWRLLLKSPRNTNVQSIIQEWLPRVKRDKSTRIQIDVDPYNFL